MMPDASLEIGLVNNMPDSALRATERQFTTLLHAAAEGMRVRLTLATLPGVPRSDWARDHVDAHYTTLDQLCDGHLDGLIVTGTEPRAATLEEEPYWRQLTQLVDWAAHNTQTTVWSCLAAHAAVLHLDGIERCRLRDKRFGVFECERLSDHALLAGANGALRTPHSRWNDLPLDALRACGYEILTWSRGAGVDAFVKQRESQFVFVQGHPEYDVDALLLEYRRDIGRFLRGERDTYPPAPEGYLDRDTGERMSKLRDQARSDRREELLQDFFTADLAGKVENSWQGAATNLYRNWLRFMRDRKERAGSRARSTPASVRAGHPAVRTMMRFEIQPVHQSVLPGVARFLHRWHEERAPRSVHAVRKDPQSLERCLRWLLIENPVANGTPHHGFCARDDAGEIRDSCSVFRTRSRSGTASCWRCAPVATSWNPTLGRLASFCSRSI